MHLKKRLDTKLETEEQNFLEKAKKKEKQKRKIIKQKKKQQNKTKCDSATLLELNLQSLISQFHSSKSETQAQTIDNFQIER